MISQPMDILKAYPIRKSKKQKQAFREDVLAYAESLGYDCHVEEGSMGAKNIVIGNQEKASYLITAHYDTPASIGLPNVLTPCNPVTYILWQLLIVGAFVVFALACGFGFMWITGNERAGFFFGYILYFIPLILMMVGPANKSNVNDNSSGVITALEIAAAMPEAHRSKVCIVLFDLEELGLVGSAAYRKAHKNLTDLQTIINLDCVGDGDHLIIFPTKKARKKQELLDSFVRITGTQGRKQLLLKSSGFYTYPSDQKNFPCGVGIAAFHQKKYIGYYCDKIHTSRDTVLDPENVELLRSALIRYITGDQN